MLRLLFRLLVLAAIVGAVTVVYFHYKGSDVPVDAEALPKTVAKGAGLAEKALAEAALTAKIRSKMALDDTIDASAINVDTSGTTVIVNGSVTTEKQRQRVLQLARETAGVTSVVDRVKVAGPSK
jgi:hypothetical protein